MLFRVDQAFIMSLPAQKSLQTSPYLIPVPYGWVARDPSGSKSISIVEMLPSIRSWQILPIRREAAQWELEGPLITGPTTSLNILGKFHLQFSDLVNNKYNNLFGRMYFQILAIVYTILAILPFLCVLFCISFFFYPNLIPVFHSIIHIDLPMQPLHFKVPKLEEGNHPGGMLGF